MRIFSFVLCFFLNLLCSVSTEHFKHNLGMDYTRTLCARTISYTEQPTQTYQPVHTLDNMYSTYYGTLCIPLMFVMFYLLLPAMSHMSLTVCLILLYLQSQISWYITICTLIPLFTCRLPIPICPFWT